MRCHRGPLIPSRIAARTRRPVAAASSVRPVWESPPYSSSRPHSPRGNSPGHPARVRLCDGLHAAGGVGDLCGVGGRYAGAVSGGTNTGGQAGGFVCTVLFGYLVKAFGDYDVSIFFIAAMVMVSAYFFWRIDATRALSAE